jgi:hypothetical protein
MLAFMLFIFEIHHINAWIGLSGFFRSRNINNPVFFPDYLPDFYAEFHAASVILPTGHAGNRANGKTARRRKEKRRTK